MIELNFEQFKDHLPEVLKSLDDKGKAKLQDQIIKVFLKKITSLSRFVRAEIPNGLKPIFGSKKVRTGAIIYGKYQNPARVPRVFTDLPTTTRQPFADGMAHHIQQKDGEWATIKTHSDTREAIYPIDRRIRIETESGININNDNNYYYYKSPKTGLIFGYDKRSKKSVWVEASFTGVDVFLEKFSKDDINMILEESFVDVVNSYL